MAGRAQPTEPPSTEDWSLLVGQALAYLRAEPWVRWSDVVPLGLQLTVDGTAANYVANVMGNAGVQRGLALYPGVKLPPGLRSPGAASALEATPSGTLLLMLDRSGEVQDEFARKALRRRWPAGAAYLPTVVSVGSDGLCLQSIPEVRFWPSAPGRRRDGWHSQTGPMGTRDQQ
jgi:hypothetical protein